MKMEFKIETLRNDKDCFDYFNSELPRNWQCSDIDDFIDYFDLQNTSREIHNVDYPNFTNEEIHEFTKRDSIELRAYAEVDTYDGYRIKLYGAYYLEDYNEELRCFENASFGNYDYIEIEA